MIVIQANNQTLFSFTDRRIKWSKDDEQELLQLFPSYFSEETTKTCPSRNECMQAIAASLKHNGTVHTRKWETIKKKINNMMLKKIKK